MKNKISTIPVLTPEQAEYRKNVAEGQLISLLDAAQSIMENAKIAAVNFDLRSDKLTDLNGVLNMLSLLNSHMRNGL